MKRISFIISCLALLLAGCETTAPLKETKSELRPMTAESKKAIADQSKDAESAAKETTFGKSQ